MLAVLALWLTAGPTPAASYQYIRIGNKNDF